MSGSQAPAWAKLTQAPMIRHSHTKRFESGAGKVKKLEQCGIHSAVRGTHPVTVAEAWNQTLLRFLLLSFPFVPAWFLSLVLWPFHQFCKQFIHYPSNQCLFCSHSLESGFVFATKKTTGTWDNWSNLSELQFPPR